jgi:carbon storage regulator
MLALSRGEGQSIIIDGHIEVKIVKWSRSSVRLAIQAPREVTVDRDEIWRKMNPGQMTPLEKAEQERKERFAQAGGVPPQGGHGGLPRGPVTPGAQGTQPPQTGHTPPASDEHQVPPAEDMDEPASGTGT